MKNYFNIETTRRGAYTASGGNWFSWYTGYTSDGYAVHIAGKTGDWRVLLPSGTLHGRTLAEISEKLTKVRKYEN